MATVIAAVSVSSLVCGLTLFALGASRLGRIARFLPYPVIGGFIAGVGWLLISGAVSASTGIAPAPATLAALLAPDALARWVPAACVGAILAGGLRWWNPLLLFPVTLLGGVALFHLALALSGTAPAAAAASGWVLGPFPPGPLMQPLTPGELGLVDWGAIAGQAPTIVTMPLIAAIVLILYLSGLEISIRQELDLDRELRAAGLGNLAGGLFGGVVGFHLISLSVLMHRMGVRQRAGGVIAAAVVALPLLFDAAALNVLPRFVLSGLLIYFGIILMYDWLIVQRRRMAPLDYAVMLLIVAVIAARGLLAGVGVGLMAALLLFAAEYSGVRVVRRALTGATRRSRFTRGDAERRLLDSAGEHIIVLELQGYIFFGTAARLLDTIKAQLADRPAAGPRYLILDFASVTGLDASGLYAFSRLQQQSPTWGVAVLLSGLSDAMRGQLTAAGIGGEGGPLTFVASLDRALERCEEELIRSSAPLADPATLAEQLRDLFPNPTQAERLMTYLERRETQTGERLLGQGDPADDLFFVEAGKVSAQIAREGAEALRLQTMAGPTVVGEIGFYLSSPRTADVICDGPCVVYRLSATDLRRMQDDAPELASAVHEYLARRMAERLTHTIRSLDAALDS
jgi:SulP family sulfate permease